MTVERALAIPRDRHSAARSSRRPIRLMIVDDSVIARAVLSRMIEGDGAFEIAAVAGTAEDAIAALHQVRVDIVILDLEMPGAGGLKSIPRILAAAAGAKVMIVSSLAEEGAEQTVAALALGAADTLPKPGTGRFNGRFSEILIGKLKALGYATPDNLPLLASSTDLPLQIASADPMEVLAIGASTGGIHALSSLFQALPPQIGVPIIVTQHLPSPFMTVFARQLATASRRPAYVAEDGMLLKPDEVLLAPGDAHLALDVEREEIVVRLSQARAASGCLPSVDPMFASAAAVYGSGAVGVVLTGMGRDGLEGAGRIVARGGSIFAQDEASCAVWGMPRAVLEAGFACAALPPEKIARRVAAQTREPSCR